MRPGRGMALAAGVAFAAGAVALSAEPSAGGFYSEEQATQGAQVYQQRCAMCHGRSLEGTFEVPALTGKFVANWAGRPLGDLYGYLGRAMPQFAPGTLTADDNARILAFVLKANGYPAGARDLASDSAPLKATLPVPPRAKAPT